MELAIAIVTAVVSLAGFALKWYLGNKSIEAAKADTEQWKKLAVAAAKENSLLRKLMAEKEVQLVAAQTALVKRLSPGGVVDALNELFRGEPAAPGSPAETWRPGSAPK